MCPQVPQSTLVNSQDMETCSHRLQVRPGDPVKNTDSNAYDHSGSKMMCFLSMPGSALGSKVARLPHTGATLGGYFTEVFGLISKLRGPEGTVILIPTLLRHVSEMS